MSQYPIVMFDWGDTVMRDDPLLKTKMYQWPTVETVDGAEEVLRILHTDRTIVLATGAAQSDESEIWLALARVNLDTYFERIFCFRNTGFRKPTEDFYRCVLQSLDGEPSAAVMVGDNFESDILGANRVGISGIWLNEQDTEDRSGELYRTIHSLRDLPVLLNGCG